MTEPLSITVVGDFDSSYGPHIATNSAISHSATLLGLHASITWLATESLEADLRPIVAADALWCAPGSPYRSLRGALAALRFGRENHVPTLGTCGGYQHIVLEFARNVLGFKDAEHAGIRSVRIGAVHLFIDVFPGGPNHAGQPLARITGCAVLWEATDL